MRPGRIYQSECSSKATNISTSKYHVQTSKTMYMKINNMYKALSTKFQVRLPHWTTILPIKQFQSCTTPKIHREPFPNHPHQKFGQQISQSHQEFDKKTNSVQILYLWYIKVQNSLSNSSRDTQHVLTILKITSNTHPLRFVVLYSGCHQRHTSTVFIPSSPPHLLCFSPILVDY